MGQSNDLFYNLVHFTIVYFTQENIQILSDLSLLQVQMRDLEGFRVSYKCDDRCGMIKGLKISSRIQDTNC